MRPLLYACAFLATSVTADSATTLADIKAISDGLTVLTTSIGMLNQTGLPGLPYSLQIQQDTVTLNKNITRGMNNAKASAKFGEPGSSNIAEAVLSLSPKVNSTLKDVEGKKSNFAEYSPLVLASIYALKKSTDGFSKEVIAKLDTAYAGVAPQIVQGLDAAFNHAIQTYGGKTS